MTDQRPASAQQSLTAFTRGELYSRAQIREQLGGGIRTFLPTVRGVAVAVCLRRDANPDAPEVILVGPGPQREAAGRKLGNHSAALPVFLKDGVNQWQYDGLFTVQGFLDDRDAMRPYVERSTRTNVVQVVLLRRI